MIRPQDSDHGGQPPIDPKSLLLHMERSRRKVPPGDIGESQECYYDAMEARSEIEAGDNQGLRYRLLAFYLELGRMDDTRALFARYPDEFDFNTVFAWAKVLERFLAGKPKEALQALAAAQKQNPTSQAYVLGRRKVPKNPPDSYASGSKEEAMCFAADLQTAWNAHPAAKKWLAALSPKKK